MVVSSVGALIVMFAVPAAIGRADDPIVTTVTITQQPTYVYLYDVVTLTATISPNPGGGTVQFLYDPYPTEQNADVDPVSGTATITIPSVTTDTNGTSRAHAWFRGTAGFASSEVSTNLDVRFLPSVSIVEAPPAATSSASAEVSFSPGTGTDCRFDGGPWAACVSPWTTTGLAEGDHRLDIRTYAPDGRPGHMATAAWLVDQGAPIPGGITVNGGALSTNENLVRVDYPATDARSGIAYVVLSQTGLADSNGDLVGPIDPFAHSTIIPWADGPSAMENIDTASPSGPRTFWIQWVDAAGNCSPIRSTSIDVRVAHIGLAAGAWQTADPNVAIDISGVDAAEVKMLRLSNAPGIADAVDFASPPAVWSLVDPAAGGTPSKGFKVVYFQWKDAAGIWSVQGVAPIVYSTDSQLDVVVNDGQTVSAGPWVPIRFVVPSITTPIGDPGFAYTCDGTHWAAYTLVSADLKVNLANEDAGCPAGDGPRTLHVRWGIFGPYSLPMSSVVTIDAFWSASRSAALVLDHTADTVPPVAIAPVARLGTGAFGEVRLTWSGSDTGSGVERYEIGRSTDGGAWVPQMTGHGASTVVIAATGHSYRFRVRAVDWAGNVGAWASGASFSVTGLSEASSAVTFSRAWTAHANARWWGGWERSTTASGATASIVFTARSFAWVGATGPTRGRAQVFVDGVLVSTVDLYAATNHSRRIVFARSWSSSGHHRVVIRTSSTNGRHLVDVDGFVTLR